MSGGDGGEKGYQEARTPAAPGENSAPGEPPAEADPGAAGAEQASLADRLAADIARLAGELGDGGEQLDLLDGSPDLGAGDALALAAETTAAPRRARGRPQGSANRRNTAVFDYLEALGHRCPAVTLSLIQSADTKAVAQAIGADTMKGRLEVLKIQTAAAKELIQYKFARKKELDIRSRELHVFLAGQIGEQAGAKSGGGLSIFGGGQPEENQGLSIEGSVRQPDGEPHE